MKHSRSITTLAISTLAAFLASGCASRPATPAAATAAAPQPKVVTAADLVDHEGDSIETAVSVPPDAAEGGTLWKMEWIFDRYGKFRKNGGGVGQAAGRRYDVLDVEFPDGTTRKVFFDITDNWNREIERERAAQPKH